MTNDIIIIWWLLLILLLLALCVCVLVFVLLNDINGIIIIDIVCNYCVWYIENSIVLVLLLFYYYYWYYWYYSLYCYRILLLMILFWNIIIHLWHFVIDWWWNCWWRMTLHWSIIIDGLLILYCVFVFGHCYYTFTFIVDLFCLYPSILFLMYIHTVYYCIFTTLVQYLLTYLLFTLQYYSYQCIVCDDCIVPQLRWYHYSVVLPLLLQWLFQYYTFHIDRTLLWHACYYWPVVLPQNLYHYSIIGDDDIVVVGWPQRNHCYSQTGCWWCCYIVIVIVDTWRCYSTFIVDIHWCYCWYIDTIYWWYIGDLDDHSTLFRHYSPITHWWPLYHCVILFTLRDTAILPLLPSDIDMQFGDRCWRPTLCCWWPVICMHWPDDDDGCCWYCYCYWLRGNCSVIVVVDDVLLMILFDFHVVVVDTFLCCCCCDDLIRWYCCCCCWFCCCCWLSLHCCCCYCYSVQLHCYNDLLCDIYAFCCCCWWRYWLLLIHSPIVGITAPTICWHCCYFIDDSLVIIYTVRYLPLLLVTHCYNHFCCWPTAIVVTVLLLTDFCVVTPLLHLGIDLLLLFLLLLWWWR